LPLTDAIKMLEVKDGKVGELTACLSEEPLRPFVDRRYGGELRPPEVGFFACERQLDVGYRLCLPEPGKPWSPTGRVSSTSAESICSSWLQPGSLCLSAGIPVGGAAWASADVVAASIRLRIRVRVVARSVIFRSICQIQP
jgi:hypothetical protein